MKSDIIILLKKVQEIAEKNLQIKNILQPGIIKELIIADILGHTLIPQKNLPDAKDTQGNFYEYLSSINRKNVKNNKGSSFQIDRVTKNNLGRIKRNTAFYFAFFENHLTIEEIYKIETENVLKEVERQLNLCKNEIAHVNFLTKWIKKTGKCVYIASIKV